MDGESSSRLMPGLLPPLLQESFHHEAAAHMARLREDLDDCLARMPRPDLRRVARCHRLVSAYVDLEYPLGATERVVLASSLFNLVLAKDIDIPLQLNLMRDIRKMLCSDERRAAWKSVMAFCYEEAQTRASGDEATTSIDPNLVLKVFAELFEAPLLRPREPPRVSRTFVGDLRTTFRDTVVYLRPYFDTEAAMQLCIRFIQEAETENGLRAMLALDKAVFFRPFWPPSRRERLLWDDLTPKILKLWKKRSGTSPWEVNCICLLKAATMRTQNFQWDSPELIRHLAATLRQKFASPVATSGFSSGPYDESRISFFRGSDGKDSLSLIYFEGAHLLAFLIGKGPRITKPEENLLPRSLLADPVDALADGYAELGDSAGTPSCTDSEDHRIRLGTLFVCQMFTELSSAQFPSNAGWWSSGLGIIMNHLCARLSEFIGYRRGWETYLRDREARGLVTGEVSEEVGKCYLDRIPVQDLQATLRILIPFAHRTMFNSDHTVQNSGLGALRHLSAISPRAVATPTLPLILSALSGDNLTKSHQVPIVLSLLTRIFKSLFYPEPLLAPFLMDILYSVLPGVDPNDDVKMQSTLNFIFEVFAWIPMYTRDTGSADKGETESRISDVSEDASVWKHPVLARDAAGLHDAFGPGFRFADVDGTSTYVAARLGGGIPSIEEEETSSTAGSVADLVEMDQPVVYNDGTRCEHFAIDREICKQLSELPYKLSEWLPLFLDRIFEVIRASDHENKQSEGAGVSEGLISMVIEIINFRMDDATSSIVLPMICKFFVEEAGKLKNAVRHCVYLAKALTCECSEARARNAIDAIVPAMLESTRDGKDAKLVQWMQVKGDAGIRSVEEIFWRLRILCGLFRLAPGAVTVKWLPTLLPIIDGAVSYDGPGNSKCGQKHIRKAGAKIIRAMLRSLLQIKVRDAGYSNASASKEKRAAEGDTLPDWYRPSSVGKDQLIELLYWYVPSAKEVAAARAMLVRYLLQPMLEVTEALASRLNVNVDALSQKLRELIGDAELAKGSPQFLESMPHDISERGTVENPAGLTRRLQLIEYAIRGASGSLPDCPGDEGDDVLLSVGHKALRGELGDFRTTSMMFVTVLFDCSVGTTVLGRVLLEDAETPQAAEVGPLGRKVAEDKKFMKRLADVVRILCNDRQYIYNEDDHESFIRMREDLNADHLSEQFFSGAAECNIRFGLCGTEFSTLKEIQQNYENRDGVSYLAFNKACLVLGTRQRRLAQMVPKALCDIFQPFENKNLGSCSTQDDEECVQADFLYPKEVEEAMETHASRVWGLYARLLGLGAHKNVDVGSRALDGVQVIGDGSGAFHTAMLTRVVPLLNAELWVPLLSTTEERSSQALDGDEEVETHLPADPTVNKNAETTSLGKTLVWENLDTVMNFLRLRSSKRKLSRKWFLFYEFCWRLASSYKLLTMVPKEDEEVLTDYIHDMGRSCVRGFVAPRVRTNHDKQRLDLLFSNLILLLKSGNNGTAIEADVEADTEANAEVVAEGGNGEEAEAETKMEMEPVDEADTNGPGKEEDVLTEGFQHMLLGNESSPTNNNNNKKQTLKGGFISALHWRFELLTVWMISLLFDSGKDLGNVPGDLSITSMVKIEATRCKSLLDSQRGGRKRLNKLTLQNSSSDSSVALSSKIKNPCGFHQLEQGIANSMTSEEESKMEIAVEVKLDTLETTASPVHLREASAFLLDALENVEEGQLMQRVLLGFFQRIVHLSTSTSIPDELRLYYFDRSSAFLKPSKFKTLLFCIWCDRTSSREQDEDGFSGAERNWSTGVKDILWEALRSSLDAFLPRSTDIVTVLMEGFRTRHAHLLNRLLTLDIKKGLENVPQILDQLQNFLKTENAAEILSRFGTASAVFSGVLASVLSATRAFHSCKNTVGEQKSCCFDQNTLNDAWDAVIKFLKTTVPLIPLDQKQDWSSAVFYAIENCFILETNEPENGRPQGELRRRHDYESPPPTAFEPLIKYVSDELRALSLYYTDDDVSQPLRGVSLALHEEFMTAEKLVALATVLLHGCAQFTERVYLRRRQESNVEISDLEKRSMELHQQLGVGLARGALKALLHPLQSARNFIGCLLAVLTQSMSITRPVLSHMFQMRYSEEEAEAVTKCIRAAVASFQSSATDASRFQSADPVKDVLEVASAAAVKLVRSPTSLVASLSSIVSSVEATYSSFEQCETADDETLSTARQSQQHVREIVSRFALVSVIVRKTFASSLDVRDSLVIILPTMLTAVADSETQTREYAKGAMLYCLQSMRCDSENKDCVTKCLEILTRNVAVPSARIRETLSNVVHTLVSTNGCAMADRDRRHSILLLSKLCGDSRPEVVSQAQLALAAALDRGGPWLAINVVERCSVALEKRLKIVRRKEKLFRKNKPSNSENLDLALEKKEETLMKLRKEIVSLLRMIGAAFRCFSYDLPDFMPPTLALMSRASVTAGVSAWPEVREVVQSTVTEFRRTHTDNWEQMQLLFTQEHLDALGGAESSPHYFV